MPTDTPVSSNRIERSLAFMVAGIIGISFLCIVAVLVATAAGLDDFSGGAWPVARVLPGIGLPIGFILLIVLLVLSIRRRRREANAGR